MILRRGYAALLTLGVLWGSGFLLMKVSLVDLTPFQIVIGRLVVASLMLMLIRMVSRHRLPRGRRVWFHLFLMALVSNVLSFVSLTYGVSHLPSGLAGLLNATTPLWTVLFTFVLLPGERPSGQKVLGIVLGFFGVAVLLGGTPEDARRTAIVGAAFVLFAAACYAIGFAYTRRYLSFYGLSPVALASGQLGMASIQCLAIAPFVTEFPTVPRAATVISVVLLGVLSTAVAYILYFYVIDKLGASTGSMVTYLVPIVAVVLGTLFLNEQLRWLHLLGGLIVLAGALLSERRVSKLR